MGSIRFKVAQHVFAITTPPSVDSEAMANAFLPSYLHFLTGSPSDEKPVFTLHLDDVEVQHNLPYHTDLDWDLALCHVNHSGDEYAFIITPHNTTQQYTLLCSAGFSEGHLHFQPQSPDFVFILNNALMMMYSFSTSGRDTLLMHSSVVMNAGKGYLFQGKSGTGKSTHSRMWLQYIEGTELLNDDNPVVRVMDGKVYVFGTPWSGKTPCYRNLEVPVGAFVRIKRALDTKIERHNSLKAFASIYPSCSVLKWDKTINGNIVNTVSKVIALSPVYSLYCRADEEAARVCHAAVTA